MKTRTHLQEALVGALPHKRAPQERGDTLAVGPLRQRRRPLGQRLGQQPLLASCIAGGGGRCQGGGPSARPPSQCPALPAAGTLRHVAGVGQA